MPHRTCFEGNDYCAMRPKVASGISLDRSGLSLQLRASGPLLVQLRSLQHPERHQHSDPLL